MNRYIKAMEIGNANEQNGISYFDLVKELRLGEKGIWKTQAEITFFYWFIENFQPTKRDFNDNSLSTQFYRWQMKNPNVTYDDVENIMDRGLHNELKQNWFLKGQASKQYLDYVEMTDVRKNAKQTSGFSIFSIFVAVVAISIGVFQNIGTPKPPFDVNVIQDKTRTNDLEKENEELKEKLYEAETLIGIYKSEKPSE